MTENLDILELAEFILRVKFPDWPGRWGLIEHPFRSEIITLAEEFHQEIKDFSFEKKEESLNE